MSDTLWIIEHVLAFGLGVLFFTVMNEVLS